MNKIKENSSEFPNKKIQAPKFIYKFSKALIKGSILSLANA